MGMTTELLPRALLLTLLLAGALILPGAATAAFGGANGNIVFSAGGEIYAVTPAGKQRVHLAGGRDPAVSPRRLRIAFDRHHGGSRDIWVMYADGSGARRLTVESTSDGRPAWSPTGGEVAFTRNLNGNWEIHRIRADGSGVARVTRSRHADYAPAWSSRGKIAFVRRAGGNDDIHVINPNRTGLRRLTYNAASDTSPAWSPDGKRLAFVRAGQIYVINSNRTGLKRLTRNGGSDPSWSPDGKRIAFSRGPRRSREIYVMNADGRRVRRIVAGLRDARFSDWQPTGHDPVIAAAGDIACDPGSPYYNGGNGTTNACREKDTSNLLLNTDLDAVLTLGDNQYEDGQLAKFQLSYEQSWGRVKALTRPSVGNHEYLTEGAAGYFDYFNGIGSATGPAGDRDKGYYSFDVGSWHIVALNSQCDVVACDAGSAQETWLRADLAANPKRCTLAFWHHYRFGSGLRQNEQPVGPLWQALYDAGADVVLTGHAHFYERFGPQDPNGVADPARGIRQFIVGTGGKNQRPFGSVVPNSEVLNTGTFGVLTLVLRPDGYTWNFVRAAGKAFTDSGSAMCH